MANTVFQGNVYKSGGTKYLPTDPDVRFQAYFYKVNDSSSPSAWSGERLTERGQYSINLGDSDFLDQSGIALPGDKVVLVFWTPNTSARTDLDLVEWSMIEITLTSQIAYTTNTQTMDAQVPTCSFDITGGTEVNTDVFVNDLGSHNNYSWTFNTVDHFQEYQRYSETIFEMSHLQLGSIDITWGDTSSSLNLDPGGSYPHQYTDSADYNQSVTVENPAGLTCNSGLSRRIFWTTPTADYSADNPSPDPIADTGLGQIVNFTPSITDPDTRAVADNWTVDWLINDNGAYGDFTVTDNGNGLAYSPNHQWHNPGTFNVRMTLNWWDGFVWQTIFVNKNITQNVWVIVNGLDWISPVVPDVPITFTPDITGSSGYTPWVDYEIDGSLEYVDMTVTEEFDWIFIIGGSHEVKQIIHYHDGFTADTQELIFDVEMNAISLFDYNETDCGVRFTSNSVPGGGVIEDYKWEVFFDGNIIDTGPNNTEFYYAWPYPGNFIIKHTVTDSLPTSDYKITPFNDVQCKTGFGGGGGGVIYKERDPIPLPIVRINLRYEDDKNWDVELNQESYIRVELNEGR